MLESFPLHPGIVPPTLKLGESSVGVPIVASDEVPHGAIQMNIDPMQAEKGRLAVDVIGRPGPKAEVLQIRREDKPDAPIQIDIWAKYSSLHPGGISVLAQPVPNLTFNRTKNGLWFAEAEDLRVIHESAFNRFAEVLVMGVIHKQRRQEVKKIRRRLGRS